MIFPVIKAEAVIQVDDKTRIDVSKSYITPDESAITLYEIEPEAGTGFIDVTANKYLDWSYSTSGDKVISVRITTNGAPTLGSIPVKALTAAEDNLFSNDNDLLEFESDILNWVKDGRSSFLDKHRAAQELILNELDSAQIWKQDGTRFVAADIVDIKEFKQWSKFLTLSIIFNSLSNQVDDIFSQKAAKYQSMAISGKTRATYRLDFNQNGTIEQNSEKTENISGLLVRR